MTPPDLKTELHRKLTAGRTTPLAKLDGLSEYDLRRPMTPTGTNLLGLVKHLAGSGPGREPRSASAKPQLSPGQPLIRSEVALPGPGHHGIGQRRRRCAGLAVPAGFVAEPIADELLVQRGLRPAG